MTAINALIVALKQNNAPPLAGNAANGNMVAADKGFATFCEIFLFERIRQARIVN